MLESVEAFTGVSVPDLAVKKTMLALVVNDTGKKAYAEKSAEAVAARVASLERRACQHAPLWPMKVPILSPINGLASYDGSGPLTSHQSHHLVA